MKKLTILLFIALVLTSCSSGGTKTEETDSFQVDTKQDIEVNVTDAAREKMDFELKKTDIDNAMYKVGFGYSSAG
nr:lipoprotein [Sedimentibacter sp.]